MYIRFLRFKADSNIHSSSNLKSLFRIPQTVSSPVKCSYPLQNLQCVVWPISPVREIINFERDNVSLLYTTSFKGIEYF